MIGLRPTDLDVFFTQSASESQQRRIKLRVSTLGAISAEKEKVVVSAAAQTALKRGREDANARYVIAHYLAGSQY